MAKPGGDNGEEPVAEYIDPNSGRASQPGGVAIVHLDDGVVAVAQAEQRGVVVDQGILQEDDDEEDDDEDSSGYPEDGTIPEVKDWVGEDKARAQEALDAEQQRSNPRSTLVDYLESQLEE